MRHQLSGGAVIEGEDRGSASLCLDHHHPEWLLPPNRVEQRDRVGEELQHLSARRLLDETHALTEVGGNALLVVAPFVRVSHFGCDQQWQAGSFRDFDCGVRSLAGVETTQEHQVAAYALTGRELF